MITKMTLEEIVARSGDSRLVSYGFSKGTLTFDLDMCDFDACVTFRAATELVYAEHIDFANEFMRTCRLELVQLDGAIATSNDFFIPPVEFGLFMKDVRSGRHLAYGRRVSDARYLLHVVGHAHLLICLLRSKDDIEWKIMDC
jgi:hypothetical protein